MKYLHYILTHTLPILVVCCTISSQAQDAQWAQFYAAPLYHNAAFAGSNHGGRAIVNYRNQWPGLPNAFVTYAASYDQYFNSLNSGMGLLLTNDVAGSAALQTTSATFLYAYEVDLTKEFTLRMGLDLGYAFRSLDYSKLIFRDQLNSQGIDISSNALSRSSFEEWGYFDIGAGGLLYSEKFWLGVSTKHLNQPNQSLLETTSHLPIATSIQMGTTIPLQNKVVRRSRNYQDIKKELMPMIHYKFQGEFDQLDVGTYLYFKPFMVGVWYRGLPIIKNYAPQYPNHDAVAFLVGYQDYGFSFGYSYDFTISSLEPTNTAGAHEISVSYIFDTQPVKRKRKPKPLPCPNHLQPKNRYKR